MDFTEALLALRQAAMEALPHGSSLAGVIDAVEAAYAVEAAELVDALDEAVPLEADLVERVEHVLYWLGLADRTRAETLLARLAEQGVSVGLIPPANSEES